MHRVGRPDLRLGCVGGGEEDVAGQGIVTAV
jgi:hypothetical protein